MRLTALIESREPSSVSLDWQALGTRILQTASIAAAIHMVERVDLVRADAVAPARPAEQDDRSSPDGIFKRS